MSENKVTFGLSNVHIAFFTDEETPTYDTPVKVPGAVSFTPSTVGESSTFYADDGPYFVITSNNGYTADLEMANIPDSLKAQMFGWETDDNGMLVEVADGKPEPFALMGEVKGDKRNRRFAYYKCVANRPAKTETTKAETTTPNPDVIPLTISPIEIGEKKIVKGDLELSDTNATAYDGFYTAVYTPTFTPPVG